MNVWTVKFWKEAFRGIWVFALLLLALGLISLATTGSEDHGPNLVYFLLTFPLQILKEPESKLLSCLLVLSFSYFFYRTRNLVYSYLYLAVLVSFCDLFADVVQFYPSIEAFERLVDIKTNPGMWILIFYVFCFTIMLSKLGIAFFFRYDYASLKRCCVTAFILWFVLFTWLYFNITEELALLILNTDLLPLFFDIALLSTLLDVWVLDLRNAEKREINMMTAMAMNGVGYCLVLCLLYFRVNFGIEL